ncbi:HEAT repeat domain-containing protein [Paractinoplanes durhamensis]|uniref:HEAT repeat domain-containing protein n=1 Tax=Paractinoplanes durhamensis TaxID=113563 RepID=UPI003636F749
MWDDLEHNYGPATDVPGWLADCASDDAETARAALGELDAAVYHQGGWICSAAPATLPFLADLAAGRAVHHRPQIVELIRDLVHEAGTVEPKWVDKAWPAALEQAFPRLITLIDDPDPEVRREATRLLSRAGLPQPAVTAAIRRRWQVEQDRITRWDLIAALGVLLERHRDAADIRALLHDLLDDPDVQTGLAATHALARTEPDLPPARVPQLLAAIRDPGLAAWTGSAWFSKSITPRTGRLLHHDPVASARFAVAVGGDSGLRQAAALLAEWRAVAPSVHDFLLGRLADDDAGIRFQAAGLLACVPYPAAADALAALAGNHTADGDAAVWGLARLGDPRCLTPIRERLAGPRLGFGPNPGFCTTRPGEWHGFEMPSVDEALIPLAAHAATLVPAVRVGSSHALCRLLGAWGAASAPAAPQLVALLGRPNLEATAATALGDIGPAAADAAAADLRRHAALPAAAWAYWRVTGDPELALAALTPATNQQELRKLGALGPLAAAEADRLRQLTKDRSDWVRTEAAYAHYRVTADPSVAVATLTEVARPLAEGVCAPVMTAALGYLAAIGPAAEPAHPIARAVLDSPKRLAYFGGWHVFEEDERLQAAAITLLSPIPLGLSG